MARKVTIYTRIDRHCAKAETLAQGTATLALECLKHALDHSDPRPMGHLCKKLHSSQRPEALKVWAAKFSPIYFEKHEAKLRKQDSKFYVPFNMEGAAAEPYWTPAENVGKPLTLEALRKLVATLEKKLDKAIDDDKIAEGENVISMRAYVASLKAADSSFTPTPVRDLEPLSDADKRREELAEKARQTA